MTWIDWLSLVSILFSPIAWVVGRFYGKAIEAAALRIADAAGRNPVHRIRFPEDGALWARSYALYERLMPKPLLDHKQRIIDWLREDVLQEDTEEIWLVYRRLRQDVFGVLYASWDEESNRCFVSGIVSDPTRGREQQLLIIEHLWNTLQDEIQEKVNRAIRAERPIRATMTEYFLASVCITDLKGDQARSLALLHKYFGSLEKTRVFDAVFMDPGTPKTPLIDSNMLFLYFGEEHSWDTRDLLFAIYDEFLVWKFEYPDDIPGASEFAAWGEHIGKIKQSLANSLPERIPLLPLSDSRAKQLIGGADRTLT